MHDLELTSLRARTDADCSMSELAVAAEAAPAETPNTARRVRLGRTDLEVTRIGIGCGNGINNADLQYAISRGVNYIFTSSDMHAAAYRRSWGGIRDRKSTRLNSSHANISYAVFC